MDLILDPSKVRGEADPLDQLPDPLPQGKVVTRAEDLWLLGKHRLLCGDALKSESYQRVMAGEIARLVLTDPPYNIPIENNVSGLGKTKHQDFAMAIGEMSFREFADFLKTMLRLSSSHLCDGGLLFAFMDRRHLEELYLAGREAGLSLIDLCIWDKMSGGMGSFYRSQHEPCVVFKTGTAPYLNNVELGRHGRYRTNVWAHRGLSSFGRGRQEALNDHPTVKPVNILAEAIKDASKRGDRVLDPFAGSGSALIAAEKIGRICHGIELDPHYADTIIRRWEKMTGKCAIHEATGNSFADLRIEREMDTQHAAKPIAAARPSTNTTSEEADHGQ